ncbi:TauD/TfdA family dioxygenase [Myxococcota bacterium]|nr:TauD/TfdA family dioxygenase [Myxococcota bacterium]
MTTTGARRDAPSSQLGWDAAQMTEHPSWQIEIPGSIESDLDQLEAWAGSVDDPIQAFERRLLELPGVRALARQVAAQVDAGTGVAWLRGLPPTTPSDQVSLLYLAIGLELGDPEVTYGRLYDVVDHGDSYRDKPIPVSQTRESTGMHTDSSNKAVWPRVVGLACLQPSAEGGGSRLTSSVRAHAVLGERAPEHLETLYGDFIRDVVTPGSPRDPAAVRRNAFPVFQRALNPAGIALRFMRYWIEKGHERAEQPLTAQQHAALGALEDTLEDPAHTLRFRMEAGDLLFLDNTTVAHDRDAYSEDPSAPRHLQRLWIERPQPV